MTRFIALLGLLLVIALPAPASALPRIWVIRDADSTIYLFGSIHVLPEDLHWKPPELLSALETADDLWFEVPMDDATDAETSRLTLEAGLLPPGQTLSPRLPPEEAARLARIVEAMGLYSPGLERMRPWLADITLSIAAHARAGAFGAHGVERQISAIAPAGIRRRAFETPGEQIGFLASSPEAEQIAALADTLRDIENDEVPLLQILAAWHAGDMAALEAISIAPLKAEFPRIYRRLILERNQRWVGQIQTRLRGSGVSVMVVGAGHLVGRDGVPALLRNRGIEVEGP